MNAACGTRPALLGGQLRKPAATARRHRGAACRLQVQALKIKWNEPSEKPGNKKDEQNGAAAPSKPGATATTAPQKAKPAESEPKADAKPAATAAPAKPADSKAAETKAANVMPGASAAKKTAAAPPAATPGAPNSSRPADNLAATVKEVAAKLGVIPSTPAGSSSAKTVPAAPTAASSSAAADKAAAGASPAPASSAATSSSSKQATGSSQPPAAPAASGAGKATSPPGTAAASKPAAAAASDAASDASVAQRQQGPAATPPPSPPPPTAEISVMGAEAKLAVAAKISAARTLARKLAEEKQAALAASRLATAKAVDPEAAKLMIQSAENEVAELAKEAARADAMARAAKKAELGQSQQLELQRLKAENDTLQNLLLQLAADRQAAEAKLKEVKEKFSSPAELDSMKKELDAGGMPAKLADLAAASAAPPAARSAPAAPEAAAPPAAITKEAVVAQPPQSPPPPPPPRAPPKPSPSQLQQLAEAATKASQKVFTLPEGAVPVGRPATVYYDRTRGPLPANANMAIKVGYNKWESMEVIPMQRCAELAQQAGAEWWQVELPLPQLLFRVDFVTMDTNSGAVDNNGARDFQLPLSGACTEQELQLKRMQLLEAYEQQRRQELRVEEDRIYAEWMAAAEAAAKEARAAYHARRREQLMQEARAVVSERRGAALQHITTMQHKEGVFAWPDGTPEAGGVSTLVYNKAWGPLRNSSSPVFLHVGYDGWWLKDKRVIAMTPLSEADVRKYNLPNGQWVAAEVPAWNTAAVLDYVFSDDRRAVWDNNGGTDYHTLLKNPASGDKLVQLVFEALDTATSGDTKHQEELAARRVLDKAHIKAKAGRRRRELQSRYLFTKPLTPVAGQPVDIFYNPDETVLRGRPDVYVSAGFNRWTHQEKMRPVHMEPVVAGGVGWHKATVQVPADAHVLDIAFLDSADAHGGFYDNNKGLDYHIPVKGGTGSMPTLRVVHVAAEMAPIAKEGGLGDVVTALGRAVQEEGHDVEVVLPKYDCINYSAVQDLRMVKDYWLDGVQIKIWKGVVEGLRTTFLEPCNGYFWKGKIYTDIWTDRERFYYWCNCALEYVKHHADARAPDIVHCHDWQSAPVAWLDHGSAKCCFTIHNLNYGADLIGKAMAAADVATTVSPTYREEISGNPAVAPHYGKFFGIRNGIDPDIWDPSEDPLLPRGYSADSVVEGKAAAKAELRRRMNLSSADVPLVGCVTRLTHQKGIHLIKHAAWRSLERGAQFVLLGSAPDPKVQAEFNELSNQLAQQYPDRARLWFAYDEPLSHLIYAGCDMFLVPSVFEPCGLTQMIAMRYGTVPVVRKTGGLNDTVFDVDHDVERAAGLGMEVNGFSFEGMDEGGMDYALNRSLTRWYNDRDWWNELSKRAMQMDWSWNSPALDYLELYYKALKRA